MQQEDKQRLENLDKNENMVSYKNGQKLIADSTDQKLGNEY